MPKAPEAFRTISEVAVDLDVPKHVLRFWEGKFTQIRPLKRGGGRRYYRPEDVELLRGIRHLLYEDRYTIKGVQRILRDHGVRHVMDCWSVTAGESGDAAPSEIPDVAADVKQSASHGASGDTSGQGLTKQQASQLKGLLAELAECKKLLEASKG